MLKKRGPERPENRSAARQADSEIFREMSVVREQRFSGFAVGSKYVTNATVFNSNPLGHIRHQPVNRLKLVRKDTHRAHI